MKHGVNRKFFSGVVKSSWINRPAGPQLVILVEKYQDAVGQAGWDTQFILKYEAVGISNLPCVRDRIGDLE